MTPISTTTAGSKKGRKGKQRRAVATSTCLGSGHASVAVPVGDDEL